MSTVTNSHAGMPTKQRRARRGVIVQFTLFAQKRTNPYPSSRQTLVRSARSAAGGCRDAAPHHSGSIRSRMHERNRASRNRSSPSRPKGNRSPRAATCNNTRLPREESQCTKVCKQLAATVCHTSSASSVISDAPCRSRIEDKPSLNASQSPASTVLLKSCSHLYMSDDCHARKHCIGQATVAGIGMQAALGRE